jgi:hypothetical protein
MAIEFEKEKCWLHDPDHLRVKRYLSSTRAYFREGIWVRDYFERFFPNIGIDPEKGLYFDLNTVSPECICNSGSNLNETKIPKEELELFANAVAKYEAYVESNRISFNEETAASEFSLPRPDLHADLYWVVDTDEGPRLIILWGLESEKDNGNLTVSDTREFLFENFSGKHSAKRRAVKKQPVQEAPKTEEPSTSVSADSIDEKKVEVPQPEPAVAKAETSVLEKTVTHGNGEAKPERPSFQFPAWSKPVLLGAFCVLLAAVAATEMAIGYIGEQVESFGEMTPANKLVTSAEGLDSIELASLKSYELSESSGHIFVPQLVKPGNHQLRMAKGGEEETLVANYDNSRFDMRTSSEAFLPVLRGHYQTGESIELDLKPIFEQANVSEVSISWGLEDARFEALDPESFIAVNSYETAGEYTITLLVKDSAGAWDYDSAKVLIVEPENEVAQLPFAPVPDLEIVGLEENDSGVDVYFDFSGTFDPDGFIESVKVDWGDGSETASFDSKQLFAKHTYSGTAAKVVIQVSATDNSGLSSTKPATAEIDFKSSGFPSFLNERSTFDDNNRIVQWIDDDGGIRLKKTLFENPYRNKSRMHLELYPPIDYPFAVLQNIEWELMTQDGETYTYRDLMALDLKLEDGTYQLNVICTTLGGEQWELNSQISFHSRKKWGAFTALANTLANEFTLFSISKIF